MEQALEIAKFWFQNEHVTATVIQQKVAKVICKNKEYILKKTGSIKQLLVEFDVLKQLYEKGIKVQRVVKTENDEQYVLYKEKYYCLFCPVTRFIKVK
ncbi:hypothetical protein bcgnr5394_28990 [Bacillus cereus]|uniref:Uncharacterized protein n=2 Tax=Bacillus cereus group TaxID=86661 RepID=A0A9W5Q6R8_BACCE|nr:Aminoglycoside phosphotransferase [Bacillus cereus BDRD-ST24]EJR98514.1 hypothetical protein IKG_02580 [Bacillus cereus VD200]EOO68301.1 hypothetical protein IKE_01775 [Bacillus cereus VD196]ETT75291.1 hypothetical protein C175_20303 [Bacillus cereus]OTY22481.1 aminoglycoside phosphotransferase [Bacillus thuringiensis serovar rongseni]OTZ34753.1 aminoglycoside phosphotransferase [Bacillus thuringiensis serovar darmstadiensis]SDI05743.1 hypothetical protein SAMN04488578_104161 [Bacillus sp.